MEENFDESGYLNSREVETKDICGFLTFRGVEIIGKIDLLAHNFSLEMLTVANVYRLHALKFIHAWHKGVLPELFNHFFQYASNVHNYNTRYAAKQNLHKFRVKTNTGKQMISFMAIDLWQELPCKFKELNQFALQKC